MLGLVGLWCKEELASTGDHASDANVAETPPKLVVTQIDGSLYLVKRIVVLAEFREVRTPALCFNHKNPRRGQDQMVNLRALKSGSVEVDMAIGG